MAPESLFSCVAKRKVTQREGHPAWRLPGIHVRQVELSTPMGIKPSFSTAHPCAGEEESASCRFPLRGLSSTPHRRTGGPGRAAAHPGPHPVRLLCTVLSSLCLVSRRATVLHGGGGQVKTQANDINIVVHVGMGACGWLVGLVTLVSFKGGKLHRRSGRIFVVFAGVVLLTALLADVFLKQPIALIAASLSATYQYWVAHAHFIWGHVAHACLTQAWLASHWWHAPLSCVRWVREPLRGHP